MSDPSQPAYDAANQSRPEPEPMNEEPTVTAETTLIGTEIPADGPAVDSEPAPTGGYRPPTTPPLMAMASAGPSTDTRRLGPSVPTVLWGLILALVATLAIVHQVSDVDINLGVLVPVVLLAVGAALVAWGIAGLARKRR